MSLDTLHNYKLLADMIPELSNLVDTGIVTKTTALAMMKNLSEEEQEELISSMDMTKRISHHILYNASKAKSFTSKRVFIT